MTGEQATSRTRAGRMQCGLPRACETWASCADAPPHSGSTRCATRHASAPAARNPARRFSGADIERQSLHREIRRCRDTAVASCNRRNACTDAVPTPCRRRNRQRHRTSTNGSTAPAVQGMGARSSGSETLVRPAAAMSHDAHVRTALANRADAPTGKMGRIGIAIPSSAECAVSGAGRTTSPCHAGHAAWPRLPARCRTAPRQPRQAMSSPCNRAQTAEPATNEFAAARTCP